MRYFDGRGSQAGIDRKTGGGRKLDSGDVDRVKLKGGTGRFIGN